ncbi:MAG TPA: IS200/IS605 family transposase [Bacteroidales bacterium]|nr:IS200/IS605 family transposase [Bacteroidales bacterium]HSA43548.1 IS200/IS605 family transposase [Bacteroidales bacterium]
MTSYRQILYHIVFRTKNGENTLSQDNIRDLYSYINGYFRKKKCHLYRINGTENHIHLLCEIHPSMAIADFMRELKVSTSLWLKQSRYFTAFEGWAEGYAVLTYAYRDKDMILNYIKNQQSHHQLISFEEEYKNLLEEAGVLIDKRYFP